MDTVKALEKKIILFTMVLGAIITVGFVIMADDYLYYVLGLIFGLLIGILNFLQLSRTMMRAVLLPPHKAQSFARRRYFVRFIIYGVVLFVSIRSPKINVIGTVIGVLLVKVSIFVTQLFNDKNYFLNIIKRKEGGED